MGGRQNRKVCRNRANRGFSIPSPEQTLPPQIDNKGDYWGKVMLMHAITWFNSFCSYNILTILSNLKFEFNLDKKDITFFNKSIYFHYSLYILEVKVREHIKIFKQEKPEMDDCEKKKIVLKEKYFEKFNILKKCYE